MRWAIRWALAAAGAGVLSGCAIGPGPDTGTVAHLVALDARLGDHVVTVATLDPRTVVVLSDDHAYAVTLNSTLRAVDLTEDYGRPATPRSRFFHIELNGSQSVVYSAEWAIPARLLGGSTAVASSIGGSTT